MLQVGYLILLKAGGVVYNYHGGGQNPPFLCEQTNTGFTKTLAPPLTLKQTPTIEIPPPKDSVDQN